MAQLGKEQDSRLSVLHASRTSIHAYHDTMRQSMFVHFLSRIHPSYTSMSIKKFGLCEAMRDVLVITTCSQRRKFRKKGIKKECKVPPS
jgi:hypothetical protein